MTYNDKNYSIEKEQLIRDEINKEHLTAHQNRINIDEVAEVAEIDVVAYDHAGAYSSGTKEHITYD